MLELIYDFWKNTVFTWDLEALDAYSDLIDSFVFIASIFSLFGIAVLIIGLVLFIIRWLGSLVFRYWL